MSTKKGFTLIELLVVIAIIALLLSILMPSLRKAKKIARTVVCLSNTKSWLSPVHMYLNDNNNTFWYDGPGSGRQGFWMETLGAYVGGVDDFRLCPAAKKRKYDQLDQANGFKHGSAFEAWDTGSYSSFSPDVRNNYGSYGINLWLSPVLSPAMPGWGFGYDKNLQTHWGKGGARNSSNVPIIGDCAWFGVEPEDLSTGGVKGAVPTSGDFYKTGKENFNSNWTKYMSRICMDRHDEKVNWGFMDGSVRSVRLNELWSLKWHKKYITTNDVDIPWSK